MILVPRAPDPTTAELADAVRALARVGRRSVDPEDLDARDPAFARDLLPLLAVLYDRVFRCETELPEAFPAGPCLVVGNHNAMTGMPDMFCHMAAFWRSYGVDRPAYGLMHDLPFHTPLAGAWLAAAGAIAARPDVARRALDRGAAVLVFPGGDLDACKPSRERYRIDFGERRGYVRLALREQVPIVPLVSAGAHDSLWLWSDGRRIARLLGLPRRARSNVFPFGLALPFGLVLGVPYPHVPLPVKVHTRVLAPIRLAGRPEDADDPEVVERCHLEVTGAMQRAMDEIRAEGRHGLFPRGAARGGDASRPRTPSDRDGSTLAAPRFFSSSGACSESAGSHRP